MAKTGTNLTHEEEAYDATVSEAEALAKGAVIPCTVGSAIARTNTFAATKSLRKHRAKIEKKFRDYDPELLDRADRLANALVHASTLIATSASGLDEKRPKIYKCRRLLLRWGLAFMEKGLLSKQSIKKIQKGSGIRDAATDCGDLSRLMQKARNKLEPAYTMIETDIAQGVAYSKLAKSFKPKSAKRESRRDAEAVDIRDRIWTLLVQAHEEMQTYATAIAGVKNVEKHVPSLAAKASKKRKPTKPVKTEKPPQ